MSCSEHRGIRRWQIGLVLIVAVGLGGVIWQGAVGQEKGAAHDVQGLAEANSLSRAFRAAAKRVVPTVVKITTRAEPKIIEQSRGGSAPRNPFEGTPFEDFFDEGSPHDFRVPRQEGLGSGVIIDDRGFILTNNHVVDGADVVEVELADGRVFKATDVKTDDRSDLAILKIDAGSPLPASVLGDSDQMEIGDWVITVGSPFALESTVSAGIISGKGRSLRSEKRPEHKRAEFLQTDAAINPGNSGGPLVNLAGEVVGINTAIASRNGAYQGVGFAVPSNLAKWVTAQLVEKGRVQRAYLGVAIGEINNQLAEVLGVQPFQGVAIREVRPNTPAAAAGLQAADVIVAFADQKVRTVRQLQEIVERSSSGSKQTISIIRSGKPLTLSVVVKPLTDDSGQPAVRTFAQQQRSDPDGFRNDELGLEVIPLTEDTAARLGYEAAPGLLITDVDPGGIAARFGMAPEMTILRVGRKPVGTVAEFGAALNRESLEKGVLLVVRTPNGDAMVVVRGS